jgi:hypothetical protein
MRAGVRFNAVLGGLLITDIEPVDISNYQKARLAADGQRKAKVSPKTVNLEVATIRAVLRRHRLWSAIGDEVRMLPVRNDTGRALTLVEEGRSSNPAQRAAAGCYIRSSSSP